MPQCHVCGRDDIGPGAGFQRHVAMCEKHPGNDVIRELVDGGIGIRELMNRYRIGNETAHNWAREAGAVFESQRPVERLEVYPQYAPARDEWNSCPCEFEQWCRVLAPNGWVMCESPDARMLKLGWTLEQFFHISTEACADVWNKKGE